MKEKAHTSEYLMNCFESTKLKYESFIILIETLRARYNERKKIIKKMNSFFFNRCIEEPFCQQNELQSKVDTNDNSSISSKNNDRFRHEYSRVEDMVKDKYFSCYYRNSMPYPILNYIYEYKNLFTAFHLHPCIVVNQFGWLRKEGLREDFQKNNLNFTPKEFRKFVVSVLSGVHGDLRTELLYLAILKEVFTIELEEFKDINHFVYNTGQYMSDENHDHKKKQSGQEHIPYTRELLYFIIKKDFKLYKIFQVAFMKITNFIKIEMRTFKKKNYRKFLFCYKINEELGNFFFHESENTRKFCIEKSQEKIYLLWEKCLIPELFNKFNEGIQLNFFVSQAFHMINTTVINQFPEFKADEDQQYFLTDMFFFPIRRKLYKACIKKENEDFKWNYHSVCKFIKQLCLKLDIDVKEPAFIHNMVLKSKLKRKMEESYKNNYTGEYILERLKRTQKKKEETLRFEIYFNQILKSAQDTDENIGDENIEDDFTKLNNRQRDQLLTCDSMSNSSRDSKRSSFNTKKDKVYCKSNFRSENLKLCLQQAFNMNNNKITIQVNFVYKITQIIYKTYIFAKKNNESYYDYTSILSMSIFSEFLNGFINKQQKNQDADEFLNWNYTNPKFKPRSEELEKYVNFNLKNVSKIIKNPREIKLCKRCTMYAPQNYVSLTSQEIVYTYADDSICSFQDLFIKFTMLLKKVPPTIIEYMNYNPVETRRFPEPTQKNFLTNSKTLNITSLRFYYEQEKDYNMKELYLEILERVEKKYNDFDINPSSYTNQKDCNESRRIKEKFFRPLHRSIVKDYFHEMKKRRKYYDETTSFYDELKCFFFPVFKYKINEFSQKFPDWKNWITMPEQNIQKYSAKLPEYQEIQYNIKFGFASWDKVDDFDKINKFVKRLRQEIYKKPFTSIIYENLTCPEKDHLRTYMEFEYINHSNKNRKENDKKPLNDIKILMMTGKDDRIKVKILASLANIPCEIILDRKKYTDQDIQLIRKKFYLYEKQTNEDLTVEFQEGNIVIKAWDFLYMISIIEYNNYLYRIADHVEIKSM